ASGGPAWSTAGAEPQKRLEPRKTRKTRKKTQERSETSPRLFSFFVSFVVPTSSSLPREARSDSVVGSRRTSPPWPLAEPAMRTLLTLAALAAGAARADDLPAVKNVERQPLAAQAARVAAALDLAGSPLSAADKKALADAKNDKDEARAVAAIQATLD